MLATERLAQLFRELFSADELQQFIRTLPCCDKELLAQIPGPTASLDSTICTLLGLLERRGLLDTAFFSGLILVRPNRSDQIQAVAHSISPDSDSIVELMSMLVSCRDRAAARKVNEIIGEASIDSGIRNQLTMALSSLSWTDAPARLTGSGSQREHIARRLIDLVQRARGGDVTLSQDASKKRHLHPDAIAIRIEIERFIRRSEGELAADRMLDLVQRFASDQRDVLRAGLVLSAEIRTWRQNYRRGSKVDKEAREEWVRLLERLLALTDTAVEASDTKMSLYRGSTDSICDTTLPDAAIDAESFSGPIVQMRDICKRYSAKGHFGLRNISLKLPTASIAGVVGPNGAGKSTLLRILAGETKADSGHISFPRLSKDRVPDWAATKRRISYVPQRPEPWTGRLGENLHTCAALSGIYGQDNRDLVDFFLERLDLTQYRGSRWSEISGGTQTRFELARALVRRPLLLILDEPLAPLDVSAQQVFLRDLCDIVRSSHASPSVVLSSQHIYEIESVADTILCLESDGNVWFCGAQSDLASDATEHAFEISGDIDATSDCLTARFGRNSVISRGNLYLVCVPISFSRDELLDLLQRNNDRPRYFRDISSSAMRLFWQLEA